MSKGKSLQGLCRDNLGGHVREGKQREAYLTVQSGTGHDSGQSGNSPDAHML